jgi:hypothetical protein
MSGVKVSDGLNPMSKMLRIRVDADSTVETWRVRLSGHRGGPCDTEISGLAEASDDRSVAVVVEAGSCERYRVWVGV